MEMIWSENGKNHFCINKNIHRYVYADKDILFLYFWEKYMNILTFQWANELLGRQNSLVNVRFFKCKSGVFEN